MKRILLFLFTAVLLYSCLSSKRALQEEKKREGKDSYDNAFARELQEAEKMKDPSLGYVPYNLLQSAVERTMAMRQISSVSRNYLPLNWEERGPIFDSVGPSNGNGRGGGTGSTAGGHTSGRIRAVLWDTLNDPTGNTVITGGVAGGVWRCNNFLSTIPNWTCVSTDIQNQAISSICQDPTNPLVIYVATGEPTSNADAVYGDGVYKSTNGGLSFSKLPSTSNFLRNYKVGCDAAGNVYLATRITNVPVIQTQGLYRSKDGGSSWTDITPNDLTANNLTCTDFEFTSSGKLNAMFGYIGANSSGVVFNNLVNHRYTANPATVTPAGWTSSTGFRSSGFPAIRTEMAVLGEVLYAITINTAYNTDSCYKSIDGGATWVKSNTTIMPSGLGSGQGWYSICMAINPGNTNELIAGGLDAYRSINSGANWTKFTNWVSTSPYVHADQHNHQYWITNGETRMLMATDGGLFYSNNNGSTFVSKNRNLAIKQFYSGDIHPTAGSPVLLAGAQDNGTHQLRQPGLNYSIEVTGGDGCMVHINQLNPLIQFGSYVYNQYRRTTNGGTSWGSVNASSSQGLFVNPFDYDDAQNIMYCSQGPLSQIRRWPNANTANTTTVLTFASATLGGSSVSLTSLKVSPYTTNRLFFGTNNGKVFRMENANTVTNATIDANTTQISNASFPVGTVNCVNVGTDDNNIIAVFSNYGVDNVWITTDGGTNWAAIDGNLPNMPVRWALFEPGDNNKIYLATEAGVFTTTRINGASTVWLPENGFPAIRVDQLNIRTSDSTIVAGTHGRGLWTAKIPPCNPSTIAQQPQPTAVCSNSNASFSVLMSGGAVLYQWQVSTNGGGTFTDIPGATSATLNLSAVTASMNGYQYRCIMDTYCSGLVTSDPATLTVNTSAQIVTCPVNITVSNTTGLCGAAVNYTGLTVSGSPAPTVSYSIPSGTVFPVGTTTVTVTVSNLCGSANCSFTVRVNDTQAPTIACPANITRNTDANACVATIATPNPTTADNCAVTVLSWAMTGATSGSSATTGINNAGTRVFNIGVTTLTYTVKDAAGNTTICSYTVTVNDGQLPVISAAPVTKFVCVGSNALFSVTASNVLTYQWQSWNGSSWVNIAGATNSSYTLNAVDFSNNTNSFRVVLNGLCTTVISNAATLYINPLPSVTLSTSAVPAIIPAQTLNISSSVSPAGGSYAWYRDNVLLSNTGSSISGISVDQLGTYKLTYTDPNGCTSTSGTITISAQPSDNLYVYPIPNNGQFTVRFFNQPNESATIRVFDSKGAKYYERTVVMGNSYSTIEVDLGTNVSSGVYIVELVNGQGKRVATRSIVVRVKP